MTNSPVRPIKRLFWDIEVSPNVGLFWSPGRKVSINPEAIVEERKIICIGWKWEWEKRASVIGWDANQNDEAMIRKFMKIAEEADELVAHFGDSFDMPWFRGRALILGLNPTPLFKTVDTKDLAKKVARFNSNKLDDLGELLGSGENVATDCLLADGLHLKVSCYEKAAKGLDALMPPQGL